MEKMKMEEFESKVCAAVKEKLGNGYKVEVKEVRKNNGVVLHGLTILTRPQNVAPTIYLESFWEDYGKGTSLAEIINRLLAIYQKDVPVGKIDMGFFHSFEKVKDKICYRLVSRDRNEEMLEDLPHMEFLDLAICFYYSYQENLLGEGTILIHNSHMEMWNTSTEELLHLAQENTPRLFPWVCNSMEEVFHEITGCMKERENRKPQADIFQGMFMKVLSNQRRIHGAACILYPGVLEEIAGEGGNIYIIPSSVHETILLRDAGWGTPEDLKKMIHEVNSTQVAPEEVLSDNLYYYDAASKEIVMA